MVAGIASESQQVTGPERPRVPDETLDERVDESRSDKANPVFIDVRE